MNKFYLDTNVYFQLSDSGGKYSSLTKKLVDHVSTNAVQIYGSVELLGEFVNKAEELSNAYKQRIDLFWSLCNSRLLRQWNELIRAEIKKGNRLSYQEAIVDREMMSKVRDYSFHPESHQDWADNVMAVKDDYQNSMRDNANQFEAIATEKWTSDEIREKLIEMSITRERINEWGHDLFIRQDPPRLGLTVDESTWPDIATLPCARSYVAYILALRRICHGTKRKDKGSDFYDSMHYVLSSMTDYLITDDKGLRRAIEMVEWKPVPILNLEEFNDLVMDM